MSLSDEPDLLDPHKTIRLASDGVNNQIFNRLVYIDTDPTPKPLVAEHWEISPDQKTITLRIRRGIKFHDATDLNAEVVAFSFNRNLDPATASPAKVQMGTLERVTDTDDTTVRFEFGTPFAPFFTDVFRTDGAIVSPKAVQKKDDDFGQVPVGCGPFTDCEWKPGFEITLVRNTNYQKFRAIDRETIDQVAFNGYATPNANPPSVGIADYDPALGREFGSRYDPARRSS